MNPRHELVRMVAAARAAHAADAPVHLATVVDVAGSAYRRPGARLLVLPDGAHVGGISGGCLERDLCRAAPQLAAGGPTVVSFDTRDEAAGVTPRYNLGCSGVIHVLVERVEPGDRAVAPLESLEQVVEEDRPRVMATAYHRTSDDGPGVGERFGAAAFAELHPDARALVHRVTETGIATGCTLAARDGESRILVERVDPPPRLVVFGANDDVRPLTSAAAALGWNVVVADRRADRLERGRFADADRVIAIDPGDASAVLGGARHARATSGPQTAVVLMTHDFDDDVRLLPQALDSDAGYVGLLGPKSRTAKLLRRLSDEGTLPTAASLDRLRTPVGLDLGGATPEEIALAILAEIVAVRNGRAGGRLQDRTGPIHAPAAHVVIDLAAPVRA